jgi:hypothetical protein
MALNLVDTMASFCNLPVAFSSLDPKRTISDVLNPSLRIDDYNKYDAEMDRIGLKLHSIYRTQISYCFLSYIINPANYICKP